MLEDLRNKLLEEEFRIICFSNNVDIINYKKLISIKDTSITLLSSTNKIIINGRNLSIIKLMSDEVLIQGIIEEILWININ